MLNVLLILFSSLAAPQSAQSVPLKRFEVLRINAADMERLPAPLRPILIDPLPDGEPVDDLDAAAKRAGFAPRLPAPAAFPGLSPKPQFGVTDPVRAQARIGVAELNSALSQTKAENVPVPQAWDGITIALQQTSGVLVDYGDFLFAQAPPLTMNAPAGFPLDQFLEVIFRVVGINAADSRSLRQKFAATPTVFFPIPMRYEMDIRQVQLNAGPGMLLQNAEKGGELALMWSDTDRSYFLTGLVTEEQAIAIANSIK
jgi:hypothetical protein